MLFFLNIEDLNIKSENFAAYSCFKGILHRNPYTKFKKKLEHKWSPLLYVWMHLSVLSPSDSSLLVKLL